MLNSYVIEDIGPNSKRTHREFVINTQMVNV